METTERAAKRPALTAACALLLLWLCCPAGARAQWTQPATSADSIRNTNTDGNVGVGTTNPNYRFVVGPSMPSGMTFATMTVSKGAGNSASIVVGAGGPSLMEFGWDQTGGRAFLNAPGSTPIALTQDGSNARLYVAGGGSGFVGIGTTSPLSALHVTGAVGAQSIRVTGTGGAFAIFHDAAAPVGQKFYQWRSEGGLFRMALVNDAQSDYVQQNLLVATAAGRAGVGTAAPLQRLQVGASTSAATSAPDAISLGGTYSSAAGANPKLRLYDDGDATHVYGAGVSANQFDFVAPATAQYVWSAGGVERMRLDAMGNVTVSGSISASYQDVAEWVPSAQKLQAGTVVVLDGERTNHVIASSAAYDTKVAGVVSESPGVILGTGGEGKVKVATTGRVKVNVDATRGAIHIGDLLVTSGVEGVAMKSVPVDLGGTLIHRPGTIIGKALEPLESGTGEILVLLSLQ